MKRFLLLLVMCLSACEGPKYPMCDYCKVPKQDARPYPCRECGKAHASCSVEAPLHAMDFRKDKEGFAAGRSVKICPNK